MESNQLLFDFLTTSSFAAHFERYSISLIYALTYGFHVPSVSDPSIAEIHRVQDNLALAGAFGKWIVDAIPVLNNLPMALASWKREAEEWYGIERLEMAYDLGILADAGLDTTAAVLQVFVLAALGQPEFLKEGETVCCVYWSAFD